MNILECRLLKVLIILRYCCIIYIYMYMLYWLKKIIISTYQKKLLI